MAGVGSTSLSPDQSRQRLIAIRETLEGIFAGLHPESYRVTSCRSEEPNCIGWAAGDPAHWWEPSGDPRHYWPAGALAEYSVRGYASAFQQCAYTPCNDGTLESGFEKVALYVDQVTQRPSHAARQLPSGKWSSKLGRLEDIEHTDLHAVAGPEPAYGDAVVYMKRAIKR